MYKSGIGRIPAWFQQVVAPLGCGWLYAQAFPPSDSVYLALPALALFLITLKGLSPKGARLAGFLFGMAAYGTGLSWFWHLFKGFNLALYALLSVYVALFAWGCVLFEWQRWHPAVKVIAIATLWTGIEFVRSELMWLKFPWMTPGHAMGTTNSSELLSLIGVHGVSFCVTMLAALIREGLKAWPVGVLALALAMMPAPHEEWSEPTIPVAALQSEKSSFDWFVATTRQLYPPADLVLWPEEALPYDVSRSNQDWPKLLGLARAINGILVLGTQQAGSGTAWFNTAMTLGPAGKLGTHFKNHPVHFFNDGTPGTTAVPVTTALGKIGTPVCFDCDYQGVVRRMTLAGAEFFAVPSMDAEDWTLKQHLQHAKLIQIRAAENGRWMLVCATSGITQIIDPRGRQVSVMPAMTEGVLTGRVGRDTRLTYFTQYGWLFPWVALGASILLVFSAWRASRLRLSQSPPNSEPNEL